MKWYRVKLQLDSWVASAWQADTIWGHLCWALKHKYGEEALLDFIRAYQDAAPLLLSNGFPGDLLPRPLAPEPGRDRAKSFQEQKEEFTKRKDARDIYWLSAEEFARALSGEQFLPLRKNFESRVVTLKNQINRLTGTTAGTEEASGQLFSFEQYRWDSVSIYLKVADSFLERARELFHSLMQSGYGKRKTIGYGQVKLVDFESFAGFDSPADSNGFVSLSNFVPAADDPASGHWDILIKYGKLGEEFAAEGNPFKKPLIMFAAGSSFYDSPCREYYGRLVGGLSPARAEKIVQYGFALPVPMKLPAQQVSR